MRYVVMAGASMLGSMRPQVAPVIASVRSTLGYQGELTSASASGHSIPGPPEWDLKLGQMITLAAPSPMP